MSELDKIINSNHDLTNYLKVYSTNSKFLFHYYLQDANRILVNYYAYGDYLSLSDKFSLLYKFLGKVDISIIDALTADIMNMKDNSNEEDIQNMLNYLLKLDKEKIINVDDLIIKNNVYAIDPIYAVVKNINNITSIDRILNDKELLELLKYLSTNNYDFTYSNRLLVTNSILPNRDALIYFVNNCKYNGGVRIEIIKNLSKFSNRELRNLYHMINDNTIKNEIAEKCNFDNYNIVSVIDGADIYLKTDKKEDKVLSFLQEAKRRNYNSRIILIMNRVNLDFIEKAYKIYGKNIRISPIANQEEIRGIVGVWTMPIYTVNEIRRSEKVLDLYSSCVCDKKSRTGEIKSLSPLEKFIAAYIMTIKFAPYKSERRLNDYHKSRAIYEFVDKKTNKKIVCVGYVHLLRELLYRMGITDTIDWEVHVPKEDEYDDNFINHLRMMIHLKDDKYNIDGIYMSDPTWDENGLNSLKVNHMLMSYDELLNIDDDFSLENLKVDDLEKLKYNFKLKKVDKLFNKAISKDIIIKAFLALEHFLDLNMEMFKNDQYSDDEYIEMQEKLGLNR